MTQQQVDSRINQAAYVEAMLVELRGMSLDMDAPVLAYFLEMAMVEAHEMANQIKIAEVGSGEGVDVGARALQYFRHEKN